MALTRRLRHTENTEVWEVPDGTRTRYVKIVFDPDLDAVIAFVADHKDPWVSTGERYDSFEEARSANGLPEPDEDILPGAALCPTLFPAALAKWRWLPGMRGYHPGTQNALTPFRVTDDDDCTRFAGCIPDLTDPVTAACLPLVVRAAWGEPNMYASYFGGIWTVYCWSRGICWTAPTEIEAWIAALEAAP